MWSGNSAAEAQERLMCLWVPRSLPTTLKPTRYLHLWYSGLSGDYPRSSHPWYLPLQASLLNTLPLMHLAPESTPKKHALHINQNFAFRCLINSTLNRARGYLYYTKYSLQHASLALSMMMNAAALSMQLFMECLPSSRRVSLVLAWALRAMAFLCTLLVEARTESTAKKKLDYKVMICHCIIVIRIREIG